MREYEVVKFYEDSTKRFVSASTSGQRTEKLSRWLCDMEENFGVKVSAEHIEGLTPTTLQKWYNRFVEGRKMSTCNNYVAMINPFLKWCQTLGYLNADCAGVLKFGKLPKPEDLPPEEQPVDKYLTHEQAQALLSSRTGKNWVRDHAIVALFLYSGLRTEELCSLKVRDVTLSQRGEIMVKRKGGAYKKVYVGEGFYPYLEQYMSARKDKFDENSPLFITQQGKPCNPNQIYKALRRKQNAIGVATGGHALRHTFVSETAALGGVAVARDLANHHSLQMTNRYTHTTTKQLRDTVGALAW